MKPPGLLSQDRVFAGRRQLTGLAPADRLQWSEGLC
jgi:hypothetical protein